MKDNKFYLAFGKTARDISIFYGSDKPYMSSGCAIGGENCEYVGYIRSHTLEEIIERKEIIEISIKRKKTISSSNKKESKFKFKNLFKWLKK